MTKGKKDEKPESIQHEGRYQFTEEDKNKLSSELAEYCLSKATIEAEKKKVTSEYKAKLDACDARIQRLSEKISNGHEHRTFDCIVEKDFENKSIRFIDVDTDKVIEERKMSAHEFQMRITDKDTTGDNGDESSEEEKPEGDNPADEGGEDNQDSEK